MTTQATKGTKAGPLVLAGRTCGTMFKPNATSARRIETSCWVKMRMILLEDTIVPTQERVGIFYAPKDWGIDTGCGRVLCSAQVKLFGQEREVGFGRELSVAASAPD